MQPSTQLILEYFPDSPKKSCTFQLSLPLPTIHFTLRQLLICFCSRRFDCFGHFIHVKCLLSLTYSFFFGWAFICACIIFLIYCMCISRFRYDWAYRMNSVLLNDVHAHKYIFQKQMGSYYT